jgi:hypothetical protein
MSALLRHAGRFRDCAQAAVRPRLIARLRVYAPALRVLRSGSSPGAPGMADRR